MQNVAHSSKCDSLRDSDLNDSVKDHSGSSSPLSGNISVERGPSVASLQAHFMAELSDSDDDDVSEVESFILEQEYEEGCEHEELDTSKFLLSNDCEGGIDAETQCRLEALLEASGQFFDGPLEAACNASTSYSDFQGMLTFTEGMCSNQDVLKKLTSSVNCALDEAAEALSRMRPCSSLAEACSHGDISTVKKLLEEGRNVNEVTEDGESLLSLACSSGYLELAQLLLAMKANVEDRGLKDMTPLMEAANAGNEEIVKLLIQHGADVNAQTSQEKKLKGPKSKCPNVEKQQQQLQQQQSELHGSNQGLPSMVCPEGNSALMFACAAGHERIVRMLLDAGAHVEDHNENGHTPLMEAASAGHVEVAKLLVERGASINTHSNEFKESALTLACYKGHLEMVRFLLAAGADREHKTDEMHTALMEASMDGHVEVARLLLDSGAQVNMPADSFESPLTLAACGGHVELAMLLLDRGANIEEVNDEGYTPLMEAAREGHEEMVALLLSQGADINAQTEETQETALTLACCGGFLEVADFLMKAGADVELGASTPLMEAAQEGHLELVRYLVANGANVNAHTGTGDAALTYACENGHTDVADLLLQAGAKLDELGTSRERTCDEIGTFIPPIGHPLEHESEGGRTPLMKAARAGHLCTVQFLLAKGADINKPTANNDHTPLSLACAGGHITVVEMLLTHGADPTHKLKDNSTMLIEAAKGGHTAVVQLLLDYPNSVMPNPPPPPELAAVPNVNIDPSEVPRVPPHGLQAMHMSEEEPTPFLQAVPRIHDLLRETLPTTAPHTAVPKQKCDNSQRKNGHRNGSEGTATTPPLRETAPRFPLRGCTKSHAAAQANIPPSGASPDVTTCTGTAGSSSESEMCGEEEGSGLKLSARLEQCIDSMLKKAELLHPSPEEQIFQKQQILEELQRVERELQEKAQHQIVFTTQQQQNLQVLGSLIASHPNIAHLAAAHPSLANLASNCANNAFSSVRTSVLDIDALTDLSSQFALNLKTTTSAGTTSHTVFPPTTVGDLLKSKEKLLQDQKYLQDLSASLTTTTAAAEYCKSRLAGKNVKQPKGAALPPKQPPPFQLQNPTGEINVEIPGHLDDATKINLKSIVLSEQQQQQLLQQHPTQQQQQFVLSEFTQNLTLRGTKYCEGAIAGIMHAMGGIKLTTDGGQAHAIPMYDPVAVGQALLQQQQLQPKPADQQPQPPPHQHVFERNIKVLKGKASKVQQTREATQSLLQAGQRVCAAHLAQHAHAQASKQLQHHGPVPCGEGCTFRNIPVEGTTGVLHQDFRSPFPVSIAVTPVSVSGTDTTGSAACTSYCHNLAMDEGLMIASPAHPLHDTLGEIMVGGPMNVVQQTVHCSEACYNRHAGKTRSAVPVPSSVPNLSVPLHTLAPTVTPNNVGTGPVPECTVQVSATLPQGSTVLSPLDLNSQTDSNHDTALTLACAGGHEELVNLLLTRGADIEHHDKKGFAPLMLAATAGHAGVVEILLNNAADIEGQAERTKDTALSLACSGGRYEVVDILLTRGANKEHRNVSDYTPLSLAASGGYVNIIKLLLSHGAEINSRTGSKLGISPLMLAAMNGHAQAVKLLLDMGSDINAQIETNRNTALTLACFQGRTEVVSLLLDRKANVEHRAKTGLTPLMEAASGGYVEVGKVLIDKGADVNAPPVPSSRDTALTIAADKGHYRFVQLLLERDATVEVKNKKGNSPLWLAANGGHLEVVQLLCANNADIDSQDNRKVSCLMAAFRKGHVKVVKWMVKYVSQFPSDQEMARYMSTINDKDLIKKCSQCVDTIRIAKERQAAEANKNANILLEELDLERCREESRKAAAARRRERKRKKKREKQEQIRAAKAAEEQKKCDKGDGKHHLCLSDQSDAEDDDDYEDDDDDEEEDKEEEVIEPPPRVSVNNTPTKSKSPPIPSNPQPVNPSKSKETSPEMDDMDCNANQKSTQETSRLDKRRQTKTQEKNKKNGTAPTKSMSAVNLNETPKASEVYVAEKHVPKVPEPITIVTSAFTSFNRNNKKNNQKAPELVVTSCTVKTVTTVTVSTVAPTPVIDTKSQTSNHKHVKQKDIIVNGIGGNAMNDYNEFCALFAQQSGIRLKNKNSGDKLGLDSLGELALDLPSEVALTAGLRSPSAPNLATHGFKSALASGASPKKWQKRDEGWKEVVRSTKLFNRSKKVSVPANAISRVIGRGGMNINAIRESSGAHIEVEKQKGQGDRTVIIRGSAESTRLAQQLIGALIKEPEKELSEILSRCGVPRPPFPPEATFRSSLVVPLSLTSSAAQLSATCNQQKASRQQLMSKLMGNSSGATVPAKTSFIPPPSLPANATPPFTNHARVSSSSQNVRPSIPTSAFLNTSQSAWTGIVAAGTGKTPGSTGIRPSVPISTAASSTILSTTTVTTKVVTTNTVTPAEKSPVARQLFPQNSNSLSGTTTSTKTTVSYTMAVIAQGKAPKTVPAVVSVATKVTSTVDTKVSTISPLLVERAGSAPPSSGFTQMPAQVQPFSSNNNSANLSNGPVQPMRVPVSQAPAQSKPFSATTVTVTTESTVVTVASASLNPPSTSPTTVLAPSAPPHLAAAPSAAMLQEYSPFNNIFAKVAQSVWGQQKEKEASKPNFASVAAQGVTSVAAQVPPSIPVQSTLTLSMDAEMVVDAAKAPGYRGNLHISPSSSNNQQLGGSSSNFGPIGSGPRSAPCTPPLGPIGPPSSVSAPSPPPLAPGLSRSLPDAQGNELQSRSLQGHMSEFHHGGMPGRMQQSFQMSSPGGTSTTFSQHSPLSSILPDQGSSNGGMQVVQSNLNPNAPDFSSRASLLMAQHGGAPLHHLQQRGSFQEPPHLQPTPHQFRPPPQLHGPAGFPPALHSMNRFPPFHHMAASHQSPATQQPQPDFGLVNAGCANPGSSSGGLSQDNDSMPLLSMVPGYHGNMQHYPGLQGMMGIRPNQRSSGNNQSAPSKDEGPAMSPSASPQGSNMPSPGQENPAGTIGEDRKLPRPIGTERAQRRNPLFGGVSDAPSHGIWSFSHAARSVEMPMANADWMGGADDLPHHGGNYPSVSNRFADMMAMEASNQPIEQTFQAVAGGNFPFMNGMPTNLMNSHLYSQQQQEQHQQQQPEMWGKNPPPQDPSSLHQNTLEHKMNWQSWSPHQA